MLRLLAIALVALVGCAESHAIPDAGSDAPRGIDGGVDAPPPELPDAPCFETASASLVGRVGGVDLAELDVPDLQIIDCLGGLELTMSWSNATTSAFVSVFGRPASERLDGVDIDATLDVWTGTASVGSVPGTLHFVEGDPVAELVPLRYRGSFEGGSGSERVTGTFDVVVCDASWCI